MPGPDEDTAFLRTVLDNVADGVYYVDRERTITYWNQGAERISGYSPGEVVGHRCYDDLLAHVDDAGNLLCLTRCPLSETMDDGQPREAELWLRHRDGHRRPVRVRTAPVRDRSGTIVGAVEVFDDASRIREARAVAETARREALTDLLTGLPNRRHFDSALAARLDDLQRYGWPFGLLIADLDQFKLVNDRYGHAIGDVALRNVAQTLAGGVRAGDVVSRWGGEEFTVLVQGGDELTVRQTAERLRVLVARSDVRHGHIRFGVRVSVGGTIAVASDTPAGILARADRALFRAKEQGRDCVEVL